MQKHHGFLGIPLLIFVVCFLLLGYNNRFASDDFEFLNKLREYGFTGSVAWFHEHWNTRWASITLMNAVMLFTLESGSLVWYHLFSLLLLWWAIYRNIRNVISQGFLTDIIYAGYGAVAFFFSCFSISDVFFWINTSTMYLFGCIAFLFALAEITTKNHTVGSYLRLAFFGIFIAGAYEPLVFTLLLSCIIILSILVFRHRWNVWVLPFDKKIIILLSALMVGFAISYSGDGHVVRSYYLPKTGLFVKSWVWIKSLVKMFLMYMPAKLLHALLFSFPWFLVGATHVFPWLSKEFIKRISLIFVALVAISLVPVTFIMSEMGPERAWTQVSVYITIYAGLLGCYAGKAMKNKYRVNNVLRLYAVIAMLYIAATGITRVMEAQKYSEAYDERIAILMNYLDAAKTDILELDPLPPPGWLHSAEISKDTSHFNNRFLADFLRLHYDIKLR